MSLRRQSPSTRGDRSFVLPFGLLQLLSDRESSPVHVFAVRSSSCTAVCVKPVALSVRPKRRARRRAVRARSPERHVQPGLDRLPRFCPRGADDRWTRGSKWGHTFNFRSGSATHGIYAGAGPHMAMATRLAIDPKLARLIQRRASGRRGERKLRSQQPINRSAGIGRDRWIPWRLSHWFLDDRVCDWYT